MLPIHIFSGPDHYVLVKRDARALSVGGERVDRVVAHALLDAALRRDPALVRELAVMLDLRGYDPELVTARSLASVRTLAGELLLLRQRARSSAARTVERPTVPDEHEPTQNEIETHWIEVELLSEDDGKPVANARYEIELPNGQLVSGRLDANGWVRLDDIPPGECKVRFPDYDDPDPGGEVEIEEQPVPTAVPPGTCEISRVELACSHAKRGHKLSLPATKSKPEDVVNVLEVVGASPGEGDRIKVTTTLAGPRCGEHSADRIEVIRPRPEQNLLFAEDFAEFTASYGPAKYSEWLWPWNAKPTEYKVLQRTCDAGARHEAIVRVYPDYKVNFALAVGLDAGERSKQKLHKSGAAGKVERRGRPAHTDWSFSISGKASYGSKTFEFDASYESKLRNIQTINRWVKRAIDTFASVFLRFFRLDIELLLPNVSLEYDGKFVELDGSYRVDREWSLAFKAAPLLGVQISFDVLEGMLQALKAIPALVPVSEFLLSAKQLAAKHDNKIELLLKAAGKVGLELNASKNPGQKKVQAGATGSGEVTLGFEANVEVSGSMWLVSFKAGASVSGATGVTLEPGVVREDDGIALTAELILAPLTFEWGAYASGKFIWEGKAGTKGSHDIWEEKKLMEGKKYIVREDATGAAA